MTKKQYNELPLCTSPLSCDEAFRLDAELMPLLRYLGSPGDWGYGTKLGRLTEVLHTLLAEIRQAGKDAAVREATEGAHNCHDSAIEDMEWDLENNS